MGSIPLFFRLVGASLGGQARYPASALMLTVGQFLGTGIEVIAVWALFHRFGDVQGWRIGEVALFYGLVNCMFALADALGRGFDVLGTEFLRTGAFDRLLLRPRPLALQLMGNDFRISRLGRLLQGLAMVAFATQQMGIAWTPGAVAIALIAIAGGVALFLGILVLQGTLAFWTVESLEIANVLTYGGVQLGDTITDGASLQFTGLPFFAPELFMTVILKNPLRTKQLQQGLAQLGEEGAIQVFRPEIGGPMLLGAVGQLQFEVVQHRLKAEYDADVRLEGCQYTGARWITADTPAELREFVNAYPQRMAKDAADTLAFLCTSPYDVRLAQERFPKIHFHPLREHAGLALQSAG